MPRHLQISSIVPARIHRCLQDHGQTGKNRMAENASKARLAYLPKADMLMPIQMRSYGTSAIVKVNELEPFQSNAIIKLIQRRLQR
jgi:hypothetical protein